MKDYETALQKIFEKAKKYDELLRLNKTKKLNCSFCGKDQESVNKLVAGPYVYICNECISLCSEIIEEEQENDKAKG